MEHPSISSFFLMELTPALSAYIQAHRNEDVQKLALRDQKKLGEEAPFVLNQINGWQKAKAKIPTWSQIEGLIYPIQLSMEQCSSEATATYKASLVKGNSFTDLTGGFGVDFSFIGARFKDATMVERNEELCRIATHNMPLLSLPKAQVVQGDGMAYLQEMEPVDVIFIDPARRDGQGRKTVSIADCEPNLLDHNDQLLEKGKQVLVKYSPMLDISLAIKELKGVQAVHIVSVENECKELLFLLSHTTTEQIPFTCVNLSKKGDSLFTFTAEEEKICPASLATSIGQYLYEPNSSLLKAGAYKILCKRLGLKKLDTSSHLYTSDNYISDFPGRSFHVIAPFTLNKKECKEQLKGIDKANIAVRNFPLSANELRNRLKIKEGGDTYLFATTLQNNHIIVKCEKVDR